MKKIYSMLIIFSFILTGCVSSKVTWIEHEGTYTVAHRGAHLTAPENTIESINEAKRLAYNAVEIDVQTSKDGVNFLMHDDTVNRTTNGSGSVHSLTSVQLKELSVDVNNYQKYKKK